jgi:hypothetical protein
LVAIKTAEQQAGQMLIGADSGASRPPIPE